MDAMVGRQPVHPPSSSSFHHISSIRSPFVILAAGNRPWPVVISSFLLLPPPSSSPSFIPLLPPIFFLFLPPPSPSPFFLLSSSSFFCFFLLLPSSSRWSSPLGTGRRNPHPSSLLPSSGYDRSSSKPPAVLLPAGHLPDLLPSVGWPSSLLFPWSTSVHRRHAPHDIATPSSQADYAYATRQPRLPERHLHCTALRRPRYSPHVPPHPRPRRPPLLAAPRHPPLPHPLPPHATPCCRALPHRTANDPGYANVSTDVSVRSLVHPECTQLAPIPLGAPGHAPQSVP